MGKALGISPVIIQGEELDKQGFGGKLLSSPSILAIYKNTVSSGNIVAV